MLSKGNQNKEVKAPKNKERLGLFERFIDVVERVGNKLPSPFTLFLILGLITVILSFIMSSLGVSVTYMKPSLELGGSPEEITVAVKNLLSVDNIRAFIVDFVKTYIGFAPFGVILVMVLGIALIEHTGLVNALVKKTILGAPTFMVTLVLVFVGVNSSLAADAGHILTMVLGATIFGALGKNPMAGIIIGNAAAAGGFSANLLVTGFDAILSGVTGAVAQGSNINAPTHTLINWYFLIAATFVITIVVTLMADKFTFRRLDRIQGPIEVEVDVKDKTLSEEEKRGLKWSLRGLIAFVTVFLFITLPKGSLLRNAEGGFLPNSPLLDGIMFILFMLFVTVGICYGIGAGKIKSEKDIPDLMTKGIVGVAGFMTVALPASMFIKLFNTSNITTVLAVSGAEFLKRINMGKIPLAIAFVIVVSIINLFMVSGSAKWLIFAPIFIPMFHEVGFSPALTQLAYRIGDSSTNMISPLISYFPLILSLLHQFNPKKEPVKAGTYIALMLPYSIAILLSYVIMLVIWMLFKLPLGPGAYI